MTAARVPQVVILDRDGTVVVDRHYLSDPAGLEFLPGAEAGLRHFQELGCRLVVITNQSGVGRGLFSMEQANRVNDRLREMVERIGVRLEGIYLCPHAPDSSCACRKPETGLLTLAAQELGFGVTSAVVIGDKASDVEFGRRGGAATILVCPSNGCSKVDPEPDFVVQDLIEAARVVASLRA
jgi:D-glycero-D-manno-heptose 1,7-bisphosphate phosphatase